MDKETLVKMQEVRDRLLKEVKQERSGEYRSGYTDGILNMYTESTKEPAGVKP